MKDFKKLIVWQKGIENFISIHVFARKLPPEEKYELASQVRRAAFSIPANIAEGSAKATNSHYKLFLENALGSSYEVETALIAIKELYQQYNTEIDPINNKNVEIQKMLISLINKLL
jgi:four helix bundle protein